MRPGTCSHSSVTTQAISVAPKMTCTSPGSVAPPTIWSHMASIDPPVNTVSLPGRVPPAAAIGTTVGSCDGAMPMASRISLFHFPPAWRSPMEAVTPVSMAGTPARA